MPRVLPRLRRSGLSRQAYRVFGRHGSTLFSQHELDLLELLYRPFNARYSMISTHVIKKNRDTLFW
jgi:hypothetical protein